MEEYLLRAEGAIFIKPLSTEIEKKSVLVYTSILATDLKKFPLKTKERFV